MLPRDEAGLSFGTILLRGRITVMRDSRTFPGSLWWIIGCAFLILCVSGVGASIVQAQDTQVERVQREIKPLTEELDQIKGQLERVDLPADDLNRLRSRIEQIRTRALQLNESLAHPLTAASQSVDQLGTPPEGQEEDAAIAEQRRQLLLRRDALRAAVAQVDLVRITSEQLADQASSIQHRRFFQKVFVTDRSVLDPRLWIEGVQASDPFVTRFMTITKNWWSRLTSSLSPFGMVLLAGQLLAILFGAALLYRGLTWLLTPRPDKAHVTDLERIWSVFARTIITGLAVFVPSLLIFWSLLGSIEASQQAVRLYWTIAFWTMIAATGRTFIRSIFSPGDSNWRIVDISDNHAGRLSGLLGIAFFCFAIDSALGRMTDLLYVPVQFSAFQSVVTSLVIVTMLLLVLIAVRPEQDDGATEAPARAAGEGERRRDWFAWVSNLRLVYWAVVFIISIALLMGFIALAQYLSEQVVVLSTLIAALMLMRYLADQLVNNGLQPDRPVGRFLRQTMSLSSRGIERIGVLITTLVDFSLVFIGLPLVVLQTAVTWVDITSWLNTAFFGFRVGGMTISLYTVVAAVLAFLFGLVLTKLFTRWLDVRVLSRSQLNRGLRDSINTGVSYIGLILAALFALSYAGLNFSNLAIIAGALGVGIGFGLQSIVNNFVSGLILLAERPIKVGDLIKVAGGQGTVKRINVRSTEIETADKSSIIVPNSSLISEPVQNWTHSDTMGRVFVTIRADPDADPEKVLQILVSAARRHEKVLAFPQPSALFTNFGVTANEFELYCYSSDVLIVGKIASDLRIAIVKMFEASNIGMPFNTQEVKLVRRESAVVTAEGDDA